MQPTECPQCRAPMAPSCDMEGRPIWVCPNCGLELLLNEGQAGACCGGKPIDA